MSKYIVQDEPTQIFLSRLKDLREQAGLLQKDFAEQINIPLSTYHKYETRLNRPSLQNLFKLTEFFDYDLSESVNHKRFYGGLIQHNSLSEIKCRKLIYLDEPAIKFLSVLRSERQKLGLSLREAASYLKCDLSTLSNYEKSENTPMIDTFIKLSELYHYDISESINYKYFYRTITAKQIKAKLKRYGLETSELSRLTGYGRYVIINTKNLYSTCSLPCLAAILKIIEQEDRAYTHRKKLLQKSRVNDPHRRRNYA